MRYSREVESMYLVAKWGGLMHDVVRGFSLKHGLDESLASTPEVAWEWVYEGLRHRAPDLDVDVRNELASWCFQAIRDRMRSAHEGGSHGVH
ncbi:hypothetical protein [Rhizobium leguminosarum]|uniref:hypothetical protein n=1 Tax=Rhizobium leguminosarum TaxID=384 RepID=UPI001C95BA0C|nr:hypothetical protein [Rhizobium leguminosarum]MBY5318226.1 hypothetical protein [Rhizobium leguminosarum]